MMNRADSTRRCPDSAALAWFLTVIIAPARIQDITLMLGICRQSRRRSHLTHMGGWRRGRSGPVWNPARQLRPGRHQAVGIAEPGHMSRRDQRGC